MEVFRNKSELEMITFILSVILKHGLCCSKLQTCSIFRASLAQMVLLMYQCWIAWGPLLVF